jgi:hypothetical protein
VPTASVEVAKVAVAPLRGTVASVVNPSVNVTVPVGVPAPPDFATVAVKLTVCPLGIGFCEVASVVVVVVPAGPTVCTSAADMLGAKFASPL